MANVAGQLDAVFHALSSYPRRRILATLAQGPATVGELTSMLGLAMPTVSKHLAVLEESDLIARVTESRQRVCHLRPWPFLTAQNWLSTHLSTWEAGARHAEPHAPVEHATI